MIQNMYHVGTDCNLAKFISNIVTSSLTHSLIYGHSTLYSSTDINIQQNEIKLFTNYSNRFQGGYFLVHLVFLAI